MTEKLKKSGGKREGAGRPSGTSKGRKATRQIQVDLEIYLELLKLKKLEKSKSWNVFFIDLMLKK